MGLPVHAGWLDRGAPVTKPHVPGAFPLQDSQEPLQAVLQQTVSRQFPLAHSAAEPQDCPFFFPTHLPFSQIGVLPLQAPQG